MLSDEEKQDFLGKLYEKRKKWVDAEKENGFDTTSILADKLYPDSDQAHFIFELLQNAEDTGATEVSFKLKNDCLSFEHNGDPFSKEDIDSITGIAISTKSDDVNKIGCFGIGFIAVYAYTQSPKIWSPTYSFEINELVLPSLLENRAELDGRTYFEFPFNVLKKSEKVAFAEIKKGLQNLSETTLLFLNNIQSISWKIGDGELGVVHRIDHTEHHIEVRKETNDTPAESCHFLRFTQPVNGLEEDATLQIAIAFVLELLPKMEAFDPQVALVKQMKIVEAEGQVAVFFPAAKETSRLRFHLHAPFVPELSRASIKKTTENEPLFEQLANLAAASLHYIRDYGLLTLDFLSVLPNNQDTIPDRYQEIRKAIITKMNNEALTPTHGRSHAPAKRLLQAKASLKNLLVESDLEFLVNDVDSPIWAVGAKQKNSYSDRFLNSLDIKEWELIDFARDLINRTSKDGRFVTDLWGKSGFVRGPDEGYIEWLKSKSLEWHQQLYALLFNEFKSEWHYKNLKESTIVLLKSGEYGVGSECYFSDEGDQDDKDFPRADPKIYSSGKSREQKNNAREFLEDIGVREVGEAEQVEQILNQRYKKDDEFPTIDTYKKDFKRFFTFVKEEPTKATLFESYLVFRCEGNLKCTPSIVYLDDPFENTGLRAWHNALGDDSKEYALDWSVYKKIGVSPKKIGEFAKTLGANSKLKISKCGCRHNPKWSCLRKVGGERRTNPIDQDYEIQSLAEILIQPTIDLSKLVWRTMASLPNDGQFLKARYQKNTKFGSLTAPSTLVHVLRSAAWIPQEKNSEILFVRPAEASPDALPEGFLYNPDQRWLKEVEWGEEIEKLTKAYREKETKAQELGFPNAATAAQVAQIWENLPPEEQERLKADMERDTEIEFPENTSKNRERRKKKVREGAIYAPAKDSEERKRRVSVGRNETKSDASRYLKEQYMPENELYCQICKKPMPFRLDDGSPYFERVEFLSNLKKNHPQNYLALCPNHAAMFLYVNNSRENLQERFLELTDNERELELVLAQKNVTIRFTEEHIDDLKEVINGDGINNDSN